MLEFDEEVIAIATKRYKDLDPAAKAKRLAYSKARRKKIEDAARAAGVIGAPRPKMSEAERKAKRKTYGKEYRKRITAQARAYRAMTEKQSRDDREKYIEEVQKRLVNTVINALIAGILGAISISVTHQIVAGENTTGWSGATVAMFALIPTVVGIVVIVGMFVLLTQIRGAGGPQW